MGTDQGGEQGGEEIGKEEQEPEQRISSYHVSDLYWICNLKVYKIIKSASKRLLNAKYEAKHTQIRLWLS